jgi:phage anti-repressor protein
MTNTECKVCGKTFIRINSHKCKAKIPIMTTEEPEIVIETLVENTTLEVKTPVRPTAKAPVPRMKKPTSDQRLIRHIMTNITFNNDMVKGDYINFVKFLVKSMLTTFRQGDKYPITISNIGKMLGYKNRKNAVVLLRKAFKKNSDYITTKKNRCRTEYHMTVECAKLLCLYSSTACAHHLKMYFVKIESLFKECISDKSNQLIDSVRSAVHDTVPLSERIANVKQQNELETKYANRCVIYFYKLENTDSPVHTIYKFGITYRLLDRWAEHNKTFGNITLVGVIDIENMTMKNARNFETRIRSECIKLCILHKYARSTETFRISNNESIEPLISHFKTLAPSEIPNLAQLQLEQERTKQLELQVKQLELQVLLGEMQSQAQDSTPDPTIHDVYTSDPQVPAWFKTPRE